MKLKYQKRKEAVERAIVLYRNCSNHGYGSISWSAKNGIENTIKKLNSPERDELQREFNSLNLEVR